MTLSDEELIAPFSFIVTDLLLFVGTRQCFSDLIPPLLPQDVPNSYILSQESARVMNLDKSEVESFLNMRRNFIAYMHRKLRGSIEVSTQRNNQYVDLLVKPFSSYLSVYGGSSTIKGYRFHVTLDHDQVKEVKGLIDYVIALEASDDVLYEATKGLMRVSVYSLRDHLRTGGQPSDFDKYAQENLGIKFKRYKSHQRRNAIQQQSLREPTHYQLPEKPSYPLPEDKIECPHCGTYAPVTALVCPRCHLDFYPSNESDTT